MKKALYFLSVIVSLNVFSQNVPAVSDTSFSAPLMILVEGGDFTMGSNDGVANEKPAHIVSLKTFYIGKYEVTQNLWKSVMGSNPSHFSDCGDCPVEELNWDMIQDFLNKLNKLTGKKYRLPTEAEWEYAAAGGNKSKGYRYSGSNDPAEVGWYKINAGEKTHPVGQKKANELGIYDMTGNAWELCVDWYQKNYYKKSPINNPVCTTESSYRVSRGGSWRSMEIRLYNKARNRNIKDHHIANGGFRLALDL